MLRDARQRRVGTPDALGLGSEHAHVPGRELLGQPLELRAPILELLRPACGETRGAAGEGAIGPDAGVARARWAHAGDDGGAQWLRRLDGVQGHLRVAQSWPEPICARGTIAGLEVDDRDAAVV